MKFLSLSALLLLSGISFTKAQPVNKLNYVIKADSIKAHVQPTMYGIFFEDINMAADGGVYAELVKNRSFEFNDNLMGWAKQKKNGGNGTVTVVDRAKERPENPHYITLAVNTNSGYFGLSNEGFRGMGIKADETYNFSVFAHQHDITNPVKLAIELHDSTGVVIGRASLNPVGKEWKRYHVSFKATATTLKAQLYLWCSHKGSIDLDMVSLFPQHTWKNRPGGLRADLVQKLYDLHPGFLRFPGGCIVEGRDLANRYQWKKTIGDVDKRENIINRWNVEFKHRLTPDYYQTFGLGFMEYFMLAEDIGASPLPILNCGMACQYNTGQLVPLNQIDPYIQDALDLIEFANGSADTKWGRLRISLGHPKPFNLKLMGVGNEQWGEQYIERWKVFEKAIKQKYPYMQLVSSAGPDPSGPKFDYLNATLRGFNADILDEHYYRNPEWFLKNVKRYDDYDRKGSKIFAGEYAAQSGDIGSPKNKNNWECAMSEAAFMTGLERNADVVIMASYAPLLAKVDAWQWTPDLIWFDNLTSYGTPNYYVQQLYSVNKGTDVVPITLGGQAVTGQQGQFASAVLDKKTNELVIKVINTSKDKSTASFDITGVNGFKSEGLLTTLQSDDLDIQNSISKPEAIKPVTRNMKVSGKELSLELKPYSFNILRLKMAN
ncbi:alpha-L-arabinofuranosidase C-terminal domain-containing protein [Mucilaginibacter sp. KACC 22063]|uniref:alpha-L-arabinofuranosidase C-terminal domain-containing protein n=1 Tax=Mucilaginibacter sp. KACC 22063 TaxID=3025666 RepID=UPI002365D8AF|nr:alpha-L-arabinofuranosidase C-terminal domain-containing protein [Mucilaginibacter sp. KACC 22063]WDF56146.1 alpha-L-arabinofuranosidase C-terminal domain-containing protein [Mucilaginibacter sp. KACC 22063]